nr:PREDICTED: probable maltase [Bemisia tabaci]
MPSLSILLLSLLCCSNLQVIQTTPVLDWWETTVIYQIYLRSFKDSDGDGVGDLKGVYEKLDYIKETGFETVWIQPFFKSPMADMGYDVANYKEIEQMFGTVQDFKTLVQGIHDRGMNIIIDFIPNHTSSENEWFKLSENRIEPYTDYYIWHNGKRFNDTHVTEPTNWLHVFNGKAWTWSEKRQQYYFHQFSPKQPDLNYRNRNVQREMEDVIKFWLDLGVDGLRVDAVDYLYETDILLDEPELPPGPGVSGYESLKHIYTKAQPENKILTHSWRLVMDEYTKRDNKTRLLILEQYAPLKQLVAFQGNSTYPNAHISLYFPLIFYSHEQNATVLDGIIRGWSDIQPDNHPPNWVIENHDRYRVDHRKGAEFIDAMNMIHLLLPGVAFVYYGAELAVEDNWTIRKGQIRDPNNYGHGITTSRDPSRTPMPWDDTKNAGFTRNQKPWLPVHPNYWRKNVKSEQKESKSSYKIFKRLLALRRTPVIKYGKFQTFVMSEWTYMFTRSTSRDDTVAVIINLGTETEEVCAQNFAVGLPDIMTVYTASLNSGFDVGDRITTSRVNGGKCAELRPKAGFVLSVNSGSSLLCSAYLIPLLVFFFFLYT